MRRKHLSFLLVITTSFSSYAEVRTSTSLFDTPTACINEGIFYESTLATTFTSTDDPYPTDADLHFMLSLFDRIEMTLSFLTFKHLNISPSIKYNFIKETKKSPGISIGVLNFVTGKYINSVGDSKGESWGDDSTYIPCYRRCPEQNSFYIVFTKDAGARGRYNVGFGRGSFVGYGPRSRQFNTDRFYNWEKTHSDAIGMFWGFDIDIRYGIKGAFEFDGRDFNIGFIFKKSGFDVKFLAAKLEHRLGGLPDLIPRIDLSLTVNSRFIHKKPAPPKVGAIAGTVVDRETGEPILATVTVKETDILPVTTDEKGRYTITVKEGTYIVRAEAEGYYWVEKKVYAKDRMQTVCNFTLRKK